MTDPSNDPRVMLICQTLKQMSVVCILALVALC